MTVTDYKGGLKKEIAEVKFLIHDLRVGRAISDMIHYHVTLDADLEIYNVEQAQALHAEDLEELRRQALSLRKAEKDYQNAVRSFSPPLTASTGIGSSSHLSVVCANAITQEPVARVGR